MRQKKRSNKRSVEKRQAFADRVEAALMQKDGPAERGPGKGRATTYRLGLKDPTLAGAVNTWIPPRTKPKSKGKESADREALKEPTLPHLIAFADYTGVSLDWLTGRRGEPDAPELLDVARPLPELEQDIERWAAETLARDPEVQAAREEAAMPHGHERSVARGRSLLRVLEAALRTRVTWDYRAQSAYTSTVLAAQDRALTGLVADGYLIERPGDEWIDEAVQRGLEEAKAAGDSSVIQDDGASAKGMTMVAIGRAIARAASEHPTPPPRHPSDWQRIMLERAEEQERDAMRRYSQLLPAPTMEIPPLSGE